MVAVNTFSRNSNILPSFMELSKAAMDALGEDASAQGLSPAGPNKSIKIKDKQDMLRNHNNNFNGDTNREDTNQISAEGNRNCRNRNDTKCSANRNDSDNNIDQDDRNKSHNENHDFKKDDIYSINSKDRNNQNREDRDGSENQNDWHSAEQDNQDNDDPGSRGIANHDNWRNENYDSENQNYRSNVDQNK